MPDPFREEVIPLITPLRGYALSLTHSAPDADDLVQETLVRAWRSRHTYQPGTNLKAWLFKILRNCLYSGWGKRRVRTVELDGVPEEKLASQPEQHWRLEHQDLLSALSRLPELTRDAVLMVVAGGLTYEEAAEIAGCPAGTMKSRVNRGRERLAAMLNGEDAERVAPLVDQLGPAVTRRPEAA